MEFRFKSMKNYFDAIIKNEARRYPFIEYEDLVQEGHIAVWKASTKHNPKKSQLKTYTINHIKWAMLHYMRDKASTVRISRNAYEGIDGIKSFNYCEITENDLTYIKEDSYVNLDQIKKLLTAKDFAIFYNYYFNELSQEAIAKQLKTSQNNVSIKLKQILKVVKETVL